MLEDLIKEINASGYWIGNLYQGPEGAWTARTVKYTPLGSETAPEFAHGASAEEALRLCWEEAKSNDPILVPPVPRRNYHLEHRAKARPRPTLALDDLLKDL